MSTDNKEEDFQITNEELDKFQKAMHNEEFRKLLVEYAQEISDPENKKKYEEEIAQMEKERGMDIKFVNPESGFVLKTTRITDGLKAFVNICYNEHIQKASSRFTEKEEYGKKKRGEQWSIPFSLSQPRDDLDNAGKNCVVFDVVFHPETYQKGQQDPRFKQTIMNTALDGIEQQLNVKLDSQNLKFPKLKFKGMKQPTVIRTKCKKQPEELPENNVGGLPFPYPYDEKAASTTKENTNHKKKSKISNTQTANDNDNKSELSNNCLNSNGHEKNSAESKKHQVNEPVCHILHRGVIDFQNFTNARDSCTSTRPKEIVVAIELPKLKSTGTVELDIFEKQLILHNEDPAYHLDLALPFPVDEANGHAKFDKSKHELVVTLPVLKPETPPLPYTQIPNTQDEQKDEQELTENCNSECNNENQNCESPCEKHSKTASNSHEELSANSSMENENKDLSPDRNSESSKHSNEINFNGPSNELIDENSVVNDNTQKEVQSDWTTSDEGFVIMDDIISLSDGEVRHREYGIRNSGLGSKDIHFEIPPNLTEMSSPFFFTSPPYSYHQDSDTVTFVIHVPGVTMENVSLGFNDNKCYINFPSEKTKPGHLPAPDYALYISFADDHTLAANNCHIDVNDENLVLTLTKDDTCKGLWDNFKAGPGEEELEEKFFITDKNVELMMQEISQQDPWADREEYATDLKIRSVADDHLTIELQNNLADAVKENTQEHVLKTQQPTKQESNSEKTNHSAMEDALLDNLDLKEGILSNKMHELKVQNLSSPDEGIEYDMYRSERREKYASGLTERIAVATDPKMVQEHGHKVKPDETRRKSRSESTDSLSSDRSDSSERRKSRSDSIDSVSSDISSTAIPTKSCIRRTSSTSTDDDDFDLSNPLSPSNGSWGSPGRRNVRFNLNPSVRVFSNKKDKQRWKMEQRLKKDRLQVQRENSEDNKEATIHEERQDENQDGENAQQRKDSESSVDEEWTLVDKPTDNNLSNNLIFQLDD